MSLTLLFNAPPASGGTVTLTAGTPYEATASVASASVSLPAGLAAGDYTILFATLNASSGVINTPAGWTVIQPSSNSTASTSHVVAVFYRKWVSGDTDPTVTCTSGRLAVLPVKASGADGTTFVDGAVGYITQPAATTNVDSQPITSTTSKLLVTMYSGRNATNGTIITWTAPGDQVELAQAAGRAAAATNATLIVTTAVVGAGSTSPGSIATASATATGSSATSFYLNAAAGGGGGGTTLVTASDSGTFSATDTSAFAPVAFTRTESGTFSATDTSSVTVPTVPSLVATYNVNSAASNSAALTTSSFTPNVGDLIVVKGAAEGPTTSTVTNSGAVDSWTKYAEAGISGSYAWAGLWVGVAVRSEPMTVSMTPSSALFHSMTVERWTNAKIATSPATIAYQAPAVGAAPSTTIVTASANSFVSWVDSDYFANTTGAPAYRSGAIQENIHSVAPNNYVSYFAYQAAPTAGTQTVGMTAPTGQQATIVGIEVQYSAGGSPLPATNVSASDSGTFSATDASSFGTVAFSSTDAGTFSATDTSSFSTVAISANDTGTFSATDVSGFSTVARSAFDSGTLSVTESVAFAPVIISTTDSGTFSATDSTLFITVAPTTTDAGSLSITESVALSVVQITSDAGTLSATDTSSVFISVSANDSGTFSITDTGSFGTTIRSAVDSGTFSATDVASVPVVANTISAVDAGTLSVTESVVTKVFVVANDAGTFSDTENTGGFRTISATDLGTISVVDSGYFGITPQSANDTGTLSVTESRALGSSSTRTEAGTLSVTETSSVNGTMTRTDTGTFSTTETSSLLISKIMSSSDSGQFSATSTSLVTPRSAYQFRVYYNGQWRTATLKIYVNGAWKIPPVHYYHNGSWV